MHDSCYRYLVPDGTRSPSTSLRMLLQHFFADLAGFLILQYHLLRTVMCYFFLHQVMVGIVFDKVTVFGNTGFTAPDIQLYRFPLFTFGAAVGGIEYAVHHISVVK